MFFTLSPRPILAQSFGSGDGRGPRSWRRVRKAEVEPARVSEFDSVEAIKQCVTASLPWSGSELKVPTQVAWHNHKWGSPNNEKRGPTNGTPLNPPSKT